MKFLRFLVGAASGAAVGLLFAKKNGKALRKELEGKTIEEKAKILGDELFDLTVEIFDELKKLPKTKAVAELKKLGKDKLEEIYEEIKKSGDEKIKELSPKIEEAISELKKVVDKKTTEVKKSATKKATNAKKTVAKKASTVKKAATKKVKKLTS